MFVFDGDVAFEAMLVNFVKDGFENDDACAEKLVVGGAGFIGSHLVRFLVADGRRQVRVIGRRDRPVYGLPPEVDYFRADSADVVEMERLLKDADEVIDELLS